MLLFTLSFSWLKLTFTYFTGAGSEQQNAEAMKQEFHSIHTEINTLKPRVQTEFERVRAEMVDYRRDMKCLQKSVENIYDQLKTITELCKSSLSTPRTSPDRYTICTSCSSDVESKRQEDANGSSQTLFNSGIIGQPLIESLEETQLLNSQVNCDTNEHLKQQQGCNNTAETATLVSQSSNVINIENDVNTTTESNNTGSSTTVTTSCAPPHIPPKEKIYTSNTVPKNFTLEHCSSSDSTSTQAASNTVMFKNRSFKERKSPQMDPWNVTRRSVSERRRQTNNNHGDNSSDKGETVDVYEYSL